MRVISVAGVGLQTAWRFVLSQELRSVLAGNSTRGRELDVAGVKFARPARAEMHCDRRQHGSCALSCEMVARWRRVPADATDFGSRRCGRPHARRAGGGCATRRRGFRRCAGSEAVRGFLAAKPAAGARARHKGAHAWRGGCARDWTACGRSGTREIRRQWRHAMQAARHRRTLRATALPSCEVREGAHARSASAP